MKKDPLYSSLFYSVGLHSIFFIAAFIYALVSVAHIKPSTFTVSLVDSSSAGSTVAAEPAPEAEPEPAQTKLTTKPADKPHTAKDLIAAMKQKKSVVAAAQKRRDVSITSAKASDKSGSQTAGGATYESLIGSRIKKYFLLPESIDSDLVAIVVIRIARNGNVTIEKLEQSSGSRVFDRAAYRAINDAAPLPPPPAEMVIGLKFRPRD